MLKDILEVKPSERIEFLVVIKDFLIKEIEKDLKEVSSYTLQKQGLSSKTISRFKKRDMANIETLLNMKNSIDNIKLKLCS